MVDFDTLGEYDVKRKSGFVEGEHGIYNSCLFRKKD